MTVRRNFLDMENFFFFMKIRFAFSFIEDQKIFLFYQFVIISNDLGKMFINKSSNLQIM